MKPIPMTPNEVKEGDELIGYGKVKAVVYQGSGWIQALIQKPDFHLETVKLSDLLFREAMQEAAQ